MTTNDWDAEDLLRAAARKLLISIDCQTSDEAIDDTSQLLARLLSRSFLGPTAERYGAIDLFTRMYNADNVHIREKIDSFVNLIALAIPDPTPDSMDDPRVVKALGLVRSQTEQALDRIVADPGGDVLSALRNDFARRPNGAPAAGAASASSGGCLIAMASLAVSAYSAATVVRRRWY
ncbi:hypothetical protein [uncultured Jatrophihabitans sp.]|uniref:hypothetical protein n=1 Tax=uncultured Jatrophihabitans sp. TaxID=1610747 RepID=UPI0035CB56AB